MDGQGLRGRALPEITAPRSRENRCPVPAWRGTPHTATVAPSGINCAASPPSQAVASSQSPLFPLLVRVVEYGSLAWQFQRRRPRRSDSIRKIVPPDDFRDRCPKPAFRYVAAMKQHTVRATIRPRLRHEIPRHERRKQCSARSRHTLPESRSRACSAMIQSPSGGDRRRRGIPSRLRIAGSSKQ